MIRGIRHITDRVYSFVYLGVRFGMWNRWLLRVHWPVWYEWPGPGERLYACAKCGGHPYDFGVWP
jgi:hypothetical protein